MRLAVLAGLIIGNLLTSQVLAEDAGPQPLTRVDCVKAEMEWNDNANVCEAAQAAETVHGSAALDSSGQPLTRHECDMAGMTWNDNANVCGETAGSVTQAATSPVTSTILINIDKASQRMTVVVDGTERYTWPVSTGMRGYSTPSGDYTARSMNKIWYSKQWDNAPMPHAVFFTKEGHAIHGTNEVRRLGKPASHGCVRLSPENAATLYDLIERNGLENTDVVLVGLTPGGESKVANPSRSQPRYSRAAQGDESNDQPRRGGGFFKRLFGRR